ncbi:phage tail tape measure protein [Hahella sp. KA22]|uniref:phage tail tape measure protein n=1 Tax=Hahella sp. KA22 TaxID=1628392 RepID=UPI000FDEDFF9|nr:phage tail tape measure protein [Hahella sp. KA22]AZZ94680.1 phage tail tape measure protein [Hahella sp. KA22]QAY58053.1 phage tail tape measure protein [Hahella sp. KA22]
MSNKLEKLMFSVSLIDRASGVAGKIQHSLDKLTQHATRGFVQMAAGATGLLGAGVALESMLGPAIEMDRALGEVKSLGVANEALRTLEETALRFSIRYGEAADDFVRSSYDIQSAIAGLSGRELAAFTEAGGVLAKATKSDSATITNYMGTMYGVFQRTAEQMGKAQWVQRLAGQTASAVQMFKTTGAEMAAAFSNLGAEAQSQGVAMAEQMAVLGSLQATMSGTEAGTKYKAFLAGVGNAQKALGLAFTDSQGRLLPMVEILTRIQGKFGDIDTVAKADLLKQAFGSTEAVGLVKLLMQNTQGLAGAIDQLGAQTGMDKARTMAEAMIDPWQRWAAGVNAAKVSLGRAFLPLLQPLLERLTAGAETLTRWTRLFPNLTRLVAIATLTVIGLVAAASAFALAAGVAQLVLAGWHAVLLLGAGAMRAWSLAVSAGRAALFLLQIGTYLAAGAFTAMRAALLTGAAATWAFSTALLANPITWIVLGVVALIAALAALVIYWDEVSAAASAALGWIVEKWTGLRSLIEDNAFLSVVFAPLLAAADLAGWVINSFGKIPDWWAQFTDWLAQLDPFAVIGAGVDWLIDKINAIPGIDLGDGGEIQLSEKVRQERESIQRFAPALDEGRVNQTPPGGFLQQVSNANTTNNRGVTVEKLEVNATGPVNGFMLADELSMAAG